MLLLWILSILLLFVVAEPLSNADAALDDVVAAIAISAMVAATIGLGIALAVAFDGAVASDVAADVAVVHRIAAAANTLSLLQPTFVAVPFGARVV